MNRVLFVGSDGFDMGIPQELDTSIIKIIYDRSTGLMPDNQPVDLFVIDQINKKSIDAILTIPQPFVNNVCKSTWIQHATKNNIPVGIIWYDSIAYTNVIEEMGDRFLHIVFDDQNFKKGFPIWTPIDCPIQEPGAIRPIDICFLGNVDCNQRKDAIKYLLNNNIPIFTIGNQSWNKVDHNQMFNYLRMSKITLNFSKNRFINKCSLKGRVLEAMLSGSMIIEDANDNTNKYFDPDMDLIWYYDLSDLLNKIKKYLENDEERIKIALNGQYRCIKEYNLNNWWKIILNKLFNGIKLKYIKLP